MIAPRIGVGGAIKFLIVRYSLKFFYLERFTRRNKRYYEEFVAFLTSTFFPAATCFSSFPNTFRRYISLFFRYPGGLNLSSRAFGTVGELGSGRFDPYRTASAKGS